MSLLGWECHAVAEVRTGRTHSVTVEEWKKWYHCRGLEANGTNPIDSKKMARKCKDHVQLQYCSKGKLKGSRKHWILAVPWTDKIGEDPAERQ